MKTTVMGASPTVCDLSPRASQWADQPGVVVPPGLLGLSWLAGPFRESVATLGWAITSRSLHVKRRWT